MSFTFETVSWFAGISEHNTKEFFTANKPQYDHSVRQPFTALLESLARSFGGTPYVFRPNRDVRFSADKRPYKANVSGYLAGRSDTASACYLELTAAGFLAAAGYRVMAPDQLQRYRNVLTSVLASGLGAELRSLLLLLLEHSGYTVGGERLKTAPHGIARDAEHIDLLRYKSLTVSARLPLDVLSDDQHTLEFVTDAWNAGRPLADWLDTHVGASVLADQAP